MSEENRKGGCLCGAVRFEIKGPMRDVLICHCRQCRRQHGHSAAFTNAPAERFDFLEQRGLSWYRSSEKAERGFCRECGSALFYRRTGNPTLSVTAGSLSAPGRSITAARSLAISRTSAVSTPGSDRRSPQATRIGRPSSRRAR